MMKLQEPPLATEGGMIVILNCQADFRIDSDERDDDGNQIELGDNENHDNEMNGNTE